MPPRMVPGAGSNPVYLWNVAAGSETFTLPRGFAPGRKITFQRTDSSANTATVQAEGPDSLNGSVGGSVSIAPRSEKSFSSTDPGIWVAGGAGEGGSVDPAVLAADEAFTGAYAPRRVVDVRTKGAAGNISTDDSNAFLNAASDVGAARVVNVPLFGPTNIGQQVINIPPGIFRVTTPGALMRDLGIPRTRGLTIRGAGRGLTMVVFSPDVADSYLFDNNDDWFGLTVEDITFHSTVASASFMRSVSSGGPQDYQFNRCDWFGTWKYGFDLQGSNTNSEMSWTACHIAGNWQAFFYVGPTGTSDQFLNYNFIGCSVIQTSGNFIDMSKGGNVNVIGGNFIHTGDGSARQTFFALRGGDHAYGVMRFYVVGIRTEHRHPSSELIYSEWKRGSIAFDSVDSSTYAQMTDADTVMRQAYFTTANDQHPAISWANSSLMGYHEYTYSSTNHTSSRSISYRSCDFPNQADAQTFIKYTDLGSNSPAGGKPPIVFDLCRGKANGSPNLTGYQYPFDTTLGWSTARNGRGLIRTLNLSTWEGGLPSSTPGGEPVTVKLPLGARLLSVAFTKPAGGSSAATSFTYTVTDGNGTAVAVMTGSQAWNSGFKVKVNDLDLDLLGDAARTLTLTSTITERASNGKCILTYMA